MSRRVIRQHPFKVRVLQGWLQYSQHALEAMSEMARWCGEVVGTNHEWRITVAETTRSGEFGGKLFCFEQEEHAIMFKLCWAHHI